MRDWVVYDATGDVKFHEYIGTEAHVQKLCSVNPGLQYMPGKCNQRSGRVNVSVTPHVIVNDVITENILEWMKERRSIMLTASDWTQGADSPLSDSKKAEWQTYRQALRDMTSTYPNPTTKDDVTWPTTP